MSVHPEMLLTYTPPLHRDLRAPWKRDRDNVDCNDWVASESERFDGSIELYEFLFPYPRGPLRPAIVVSTARVKHFENGTFEDYETIFWLRPDRESFRLAWQLARVLRKSGSVWLTRDQLRHFVSIEPGACHAVSIVEKIVPYEDGFCEAARVGVCKTCGCTETRPCPGGCSWANEEHTFCTRCLLGLLLRSSEIEEAS